MVTLSRVQHRDSRVSAWWGRWTRHHKQQQEVGLRGALMLSVQGCEASFKAATMGLSMGLTPSVSGAL